MVDAKMAALCSRAEDLVRAEAVASGFGVEMDYHDIFHHCENDEEAVAHLRQALDEESVSHEEGLPLRASEDFGLFGRRRNRRCSILARGWTRPNCTIRILIFRMR